MRSLADKGWEKAPSIKFSPFRGLLVLIGIIWLLATIWLLNYYWENSGWKAESNPNQLVDGHYQLDRAEAAGYGLGLSLRSINNGTDPAIVELLNLRLARRSGSVGEQAQAVQLIRQDIQADDNEEYRAIWAPVLACSESGCDNGVYLQTAATLAAEHPRWVGHAMIIEANDWYLAKKSGDSIGAAAAVARLDKLVRTYGSPELKSRWSALEACGGTCPLFEELGLEFMSEAVKN